MFFNDVMKNVRYIVYSIVLVVYLGSTVDWHMVSVTSDLQVSFLL